MNQNLFLIGFMGTGKTTVSRELCSASGMPELDLDQEIEKREQMPIREIFSRYGEDCFRDKESALIRELEKTDGYVVSCGGGAVLRQENVSSMKKSGRIILLTARPETVFERVRYGNDRPLLNGNMKVEYIAELMEKRKALYEAAADLTVTTDDKKPGEIAAEILGRI